MHSKPSVRPVLLICLAFCLAASPSEGLEYAVIDIDRIGFELLHKVQGTNGIEWWVELDDELLVLAEEEVLDRLAMWCPSS